MNTILRIDASSRKDASHSRMLGDYFQKNWLINKPDDTFINRDLVSDSVGHIEQQTIEGFYTPPEHFTIALSGATAQSDKLIAELQAADTLLITTPMYNFSMPSALKAWIDQVVRIGHTFSYDGENFGGLVNADRAYVLCAYGAAGYLEDGPLASANFLQPYLTFLLTFLGVGEIHFVGIEGTTGAEEDVSRGYEQAKTEIDTLLR